MYTVHVSFALIVVDTARSHDKLDTGVFQAT